MEANTRYVRDQRSKNMDIRKDHKAVLDRLRDMYIQSGGESYNEPEAWGLDDRVVTSGDDSHYTLEMDGGHPYRLHTNIGCYVIIGGHCGGDGKQFIRLLDREFNISVLTPRYSIDDGDERHPMLRWPGPTLVISMKPSNLKNKELLLRPYYAIVAEHDDSDTPYDALGNEKV